MKFLKRKRNILNELLKREKIYFKDHVGPRGRWENQINTNFPPRIITVRTTYRNKRT